jgi:hypothetical protein
MLLHEHLAAGHPDADHVDADRGEPPVLMGQPDAGQPPQPPQLHRRHRLHRTARTHRPPGLDLADHQTVTVHRDDVDLPHATAPVPFQHAQSGPLEVSHRDVLTQPTDLVPGHHHAGHLPSDADQDPGGEGRKTVGGRKCG